MYISVVALNSYTQDVDARFLLLPWVHSSLAVHCELPENRGWWYRCVNFTFYKLALEEVVALNTLYRRDA